MHLRVFLLVSLAFTVFSSGKFNAPLSLKVGYPGSSFVWHYKGVLRNPFTGNQIAGVEGLEFTKSINFTKSQQTSTISYITRKCFLYTTATNMSVPLTEFAINRISPSRRVNPSKLMSQCITLNKTKNHKVISSIQYPSGRRIESMNINIDLDSLQSSAERHMAISSTIKSKKSTWQSNSFVSFIFPFFSQKQPFNQEIYSLKEINTKSFTSLFNPNEIQFSPNAVMTYNRFGESPFWFSTSKPCIVELTACRYNGQHNIYSNPHLQNVLQLIEQACPHFLQPPLNSNSNHIKGRANVLDQSVKDPMKTHTDMKEKRAGEGVTKFRIRNRILDSFRQYQWPITITNTSTNTDSTTCCAGMPANNTQTKWQPKYYNSYMYALRHRAKAIGDVTPSSTNSVHPPRERFLRACDFPTTFTEYDLRNDPLAMFVPWYRRVEKFLKGLHSI